MRLFPGLLAVVVPLARAAETECLPFCLDTPCSDLNGNVAHECGACDSAAACHPGAASFAEPGSSSSASAATEDPEPENEVSLVEEAALPMLERWHARRGLDASRRPKHLLYAAEAGVFHVGFDCAARGEETAPDGTLRALHRDAQSTAWRFDDDGELVQPSIAARMAALCRGTTPSESIDVGSWELCTQPDPAGEKPKGVLNRTCALARHRAFWGDDFAPHELASSAGAASVADAASTVAPPGHLRRFGEQGQRRVALPEVDGCVDARSFFAAHVDAHTPLLMRGCANLSNPFALRHWDDAHLLATAPEHATERDSCRAPLRDFLARYTDGGHALSLIHI